jgi:hypothetical protein
MVCCVTDTTYTSDRMRDLAGINKASTFFAASVCTRLVFTPATGHVPLLTKPVALGICWLQLRLSEAEYMRYSNMLGSGSWEGASFEMMDIMKHSHVRRMDRFLEFTIRTFHDGRLMFSLVDRAGYHPVFHPHSSRITPFPANGVKGIG